MLAFRKATFFRSSQSSGEVNSVIIRVSLGDGDKVVGSPAVTLNFNNLEKNMEKKSVACNYWKEAGT